MKRNLAILFALIVVLAAGVAGATTVVKLDFDGLVKASDAVIVGRVASVEPFQQKRRVFTKIAVNVEETLKGEHASTVEIIHIGGRTEKLATVVHGMPGFVVGEHVLLFLERPDGASHFVVTGLSQGKILLDDQAAGPPKLKHSDTAGLHTVDPPSLQSSKDAPSSASAPIVTLDDARRRITALLPTKRAE